jgi:hypothetical protein
MTFSYKDKTYIESLEQWWKKNLVSEGVCLLRMVLCLYLILIEKCKCILIPKDTKTAGTESHNKIDKS